MENQIFEIRSYRNTDGALLYALTPPPLNGPLVYVARNYESLLCSILDLFARRGVWHSLPAHTAEYGVRLKNENEETKLNKNQIRVLNELIRRENNNSRIYQELSTIGMHSHHTIHKL